MAYTKKIRFQVYKTEVDEIGNQCGKWADIFETWANVNGVGGREYYSARQTNSENDIIFKVRYSRKIADFLTSEIRIIYKNMIFDVQHVDDYMERNLELVFRTKLLNRSEENG